MQDNNNEKKILENVKSFSMIIQTHLKMKKKPLMYKYDSLKMYHE